jgi:hypothetical protein
MKLLLLIFLSLLTRAVYALDYVAIPYRVEAPESLAQSMTKFIKTGKVISKGSRSLQLTKKSHTGPPPSSWNSLPAGFTITLYIDSLLIEPNKIPNVYSSIEPNKIPDVSSLIQPNKIPDVISSIEPNKAPDDSSSIEPDKIPSLEDSENLQEDGLAFRKKLNASMFFAASQGFFDQKSDRYPDVNFEQNSPYTLGLSANYRYTNVWSTSSSLYISALKAAGSNLNNQKVVLPHEVGATLYAERFFQTGTVTLYAGADYEQFSTFNLPGIDQTGKISVDSNEVYYLTFGMSKNFTLFGKSFFSKLSSSKSIISTYRPGTASPGYDGALQGYKFLAFMSTEIANNFSLNAFVKQHLMQAEHDLKVLRLGIGFGYTFL